jgi:hypothetical protein
MDAPAHWTGTDRFERRLVLWAMVASVAGSLVLLVFRKFS